jgi:hypothetical protein
VHSQWLAYFLKSLRFDWVYSKYRASSRL